MCEPEYVSKIIFPCTLFPQTSWESWNLYSSESSEVILYLVVVTGVVVILVGGKAGLWKFH